MISLLSTPLAALESAAGDLTGTTLGLAAVGVFGLAYILVVAEDLIHLRKSKPMLLAAGILWILTAIAIGDGDLIAEHVDEHVADFAELFLFLMVAMTYISAIGKRNVFLKINSLLVGAGFGLRAVFWTTGVLSFLISPIADNLTTALLMGAVVTTVGAGNARFIGLACTNVVVAANAGGAFSPFGDITTLMVWQAGMVPTTEFLHLIPPSLVNWLVPAALMHFAVPNVKPESDNEQVELGQGWLTVILLFLATIATAVGFHVVLHLPPFLGMMTGLSYYMVYGYIDRLSKRRYEMAEPIDIFDDVADVEWDTLLFFFGVLMGVGALSELGYLALTSTALYDGLGPTTANIGIGVVSAIVDNVPVMFAVLSMQPEMGTTEAEVLYQWLLATLAAGVGGSLLSVGSAAGVALMGSAKGQYTFTSHLKWTPVIALGYAASIAVHYYLNAPEAAVDAVEAATRATG
ncbi:MAG: sodium:proton antiporter NhaD, partial [Planctomycetota bacterium]